MLQLRQVLQSPFNQYGASYLRIRSPLPKNTEPFNEMISRGYNLRL